MVPADSRAGREPFGLHPDWELAKANTQVDVRVQIALALVERDGLWLVSRRSSGRIFAGLWEFPGGKLAVGESPSAAAAREAWEETGLSVEPVADLGHVETRHDDRIVILHLIRCRAVGGHARPSDPAVDDVRWVSPAELRTLPMPPANARILERLLAPDR